MNTTAHVAVSALVWRNEPGYSGATAVTLGALMPDLPMFGFYAYQKLVGSSEEEIWTSLYFSEGWQYLFDVFNSIPLALVLLGICYACGFRWGILFAASALLHLFCDLPLHNDDAHRHFLPLTDWRFRSAVSYWDSRYYGHIFIWFEFVFVVGSCVFVGWSGEHWPMRIVAITTLTLHLAFVVFALVMWMPDT